MEDLLAVLIPAVVAAWGVPVESVVIGAPGAERVTQPNSSISWAAEVIDRVPGGFDVHIDGLEITYAGAPYGTSNDGSLAKRDMANALLAQITDEEWQNFGLDGAEFRMLEDIDKPVAGRILLTIAIASADFTVCG